MKFKLSIFEISCIMSVSYFFSSVLQPLWGYIEDRQKQYSFVLPGCFLTGFCISLICATDNIYLFILLVLAANLGEGIYHPQATAFVNNLSDSCNSSKNLGTYLCLGSLGFAVGPALSGYIADYAGTQYFSYLLIPTVLMMILLYYSVHNVRNKQLCKNDFNFGESIKEIIKNKNLKTLVFIGFIRPLILVSLCIYMPFIWKTMGYSTFKTGILLGIFSAAGSLGSLIGGILFSKFNNRVVFLSSVVLTAICGVIYLTHLHNYAFLAFFFMTSFFVNIIASVNLSLAYKHLPQNASALTGLINGFNWGVIGLSLGLIGLFIQTFNGVNVLLVIMLVPLSYLRGINTLFKDVKQSVG